MCKAISLKLLQDDRVLSHPDDDSHSAICVLHNIKDDTYTGGYIDLSGCRTDITIPDSIKNKIIR